MSILEHMGRNPKRPKIRNVRIPLFHNKAILQKTINIQKCRKISRFLETKQNNKSKAFQKMKINKYTWKFKKKKDVYS